MPFGMRGLMRLMDRSELQSSGEHVHGIFYVAFLFPFVIFTIGFAAVLNMMLKRAKRSGGMQPNLPVEDGTTTPVHTPPLPDVIQLMREGRSVDDVCRAVDPQFDTRPELLKRMIRQSIEMAEKSGAQHVSLGIQVNSSSQIPRELSPRALHSAELVLQSGGTMPDACRLVDSRYDTRDVHGQRAVEHLLSAALEQRKHATAAPSTSDPLPPTNTAH
jgi:hypothetical protein